MQQRKNIQAAALLAATAMAWSPAFAQNDARMERMERAIENLQAELDRVSAELAAERAAAARREEAMREEQQEGGVVRTKGEDITLTTTGGGFKLQSDDGDAFLFAGRLVFDYDFYDDVYNPEANRRDEMGNLVVREGGDSASEGQWRRARLTARGWINSVWEYHFKADINDQRESARLHTGYIAYSGFKPTTLWVGKFKEPFGFESLISANWTTAIERSFINDVTERLQPRTGGIMASGYHKDYAHFNWALGVFDDGDQDEDGEDSYTYGGRIAFAPHFADGSLLHLGAAYSTRDREGGAQNVRTRLGVNTADRLTLGSTRADDVDQFGLEAAYARGPFSAQAEYAWVEADGASILSDHDDNTATPNVNVEHPDIDIDSWYLQLAYTLTGEPRVYKTKGAKFDRIKPAGAWGAWELFARYEELEVDQDNRGDGKPDELDAEKYVFGVNWYPNKNVKFSMNYTDAEVDSEAVEADEDDDGDALSFRAQYAW